MKASSTRSSKTQGASMNGNPKKPEEASDEKKAAMPIGKLTRSKAREQNGMSGPSNKELKSKEENKKKKGDKDENVVDEPSTHENQNEEPANEEKKKEEREKSERKTQEEGEKTKKKMANLKKEKDKESEEEAPRPRKKERTSIRATEFVKSEKKETKSIMEYFLNGKTSDQLEKKSTEETDDKDGESEEDYKTSEEIIKMQEEKQMIERENTMLLKDKAFYKKEFERLSSLNASFKMKNDILLKKRQATETITDTYITEDTGLFKGIIKKVSPSSKNRQSLSKKRNQDVSTSSGKNGEIQEENKRSTSGLEIEQILSENELDEEEGRLDLNKISKIEGCLVFGKELLVEVFFEPNEASFFLKKPRLVPLSMLLENSGSRKAAQDFLVSEYHQMLGSFHASMKEAIDAEGQSFKAIREYQYLLDNLIGNYDKEIFNKSSIE